MDLFAFTEEILHGKLHFLCSVNEVYFILFANVNKELERC